MSQTATREIECNCGAKLSVLCADSVNAERHPHMRQAVLERMLHVFRCSACDVNVVVENRFWYIDLVRGQFYGVFPTAERANERACAKAVYEAFDFALGSRAGATARAMFQPDRMHVRVCFGNEELREKLVVSDAGLLDLPLEILKARLLAGGAGVVTELEMLDVQTMRLDHVEDNGDLAFHFEQAGKPTRVLEVGLVVARAAYEEIAAIPWQRLIAEYPDIASGPHVSLLRLTVPGVLPAQRSV